MNRTSATACSGALATLVALATISAGAQEERRRPGAQAPRPAPTEEPAPPKVRETPRAEPEPEAPRRRRPGIDGDVAKPAIIPAPVTEAAPSIEASTPDAASQRRRPGQPAFSAPTASGERLDPGAPKGDRRQLNVNRRSNLKAIGPPPVDAVYEKKVVPDRWQLTKQLGLTNYSWLDPYNQNTLKGDRPLFGQWFFALNVISDTVIEPRRIPTPVAPQGEGGPVNSDLIGNGKQLILAENLAVGLVLYKGNTTFMPPDWEFRFTPVFNVNRVSVEQNRALKINPADGTTRRDSQIGVQELFVDKHLWDVSARYDFDSLRIGIQPFNADFRGFLFRDNQLGARLFGNRSNNIFQYNVAWFRRLEKDTNSGLNDLSQDIRKDDVFVGNVFWNDFPVIGFNSQVVGLYNRNREGDEPTFFDENGFIQRPFSFGIEKPRNYDVGYVGLNGDGHFGILNFTGSAYAAIGEEDRGVFVDRPTDIAAFLLAAEAGMDFDWRRIRVSALYASGDDDPYDDVESGFDAVFEAPLFAGADTSFWIRQNVPLIGGGGVTISTRDGVLNALRSSKEQGQSNFTNPGTVLIGVGADFDLTPTWRVSGNVNHIAFATTEVIETARQQANVSREIGLDLSVSTIWRPFFTQNIVIRASGAALIPGKGYKQLFGDEVPYSVLVNLIFTY
jgi:hypothetical protein